MKCMKYMKMKLNTSWSTVVELDLLRDYVYYGMY